jgi:hypothetical protein
MGSFTEFLPTYSNRWRGLKVMANILSPDKKEQRSSMAARRPEKGKILRYKYPAIIKWIKNMSDRIYLAFRANWLQFIFHGADLNEFRYSLISRSK